MEQVLKLWEQQTSIVAESQVKTCSKAVLCNHWKQKNWKLSFEKKTSNAIYSSMVLYIFMNS